MGAFFDNEELDDLFFESLDEAEEAAKEEPEQDKLHYDEISNTELIDSLDDDIEEVSDEELDNLNYTYPGIKGDYKFKQQYHKVRAIDPTTQKERFAKIARVSSKYGVPKEILAGIYGAESNFGKHGTQVSSAGALGPFQFMPDTARQYGISDPFDFDQSLEGAAKYMSHSFKVTKNWPDAIASYNAGLGNVKRWRNIKETRDYVPKVLGFANDLKGTFQQGGFTYAQAGTFKAPGDPFQDPEYFNKQQSAISVPYYNLGENLKNNIGYSPVQRGEHTIPPQDLSKTIANSSNIMNSTKARADVKPTEVPVVDPITAVISAVDKQGAALFNGINTLYNGFKDGRDLIAKTADAGLSAAQAVFGERANQRAFNKQLKNMYRESENDYYSANQQYNV